MKKFLLTVVGVMCTLAMSAAVTDLNFTSVKKAAGGGEIWYTTATNVAAAAGWCSTNTNGSNSKPANITPNLKGDVTETTTFKADGVLVKGGNTTSDIATSAKVLVFKVTNITGITAYGATTSSTNAAGFKWSIYDASTKSAVVSSVAGAVAAPLAKMYIAQMTGENNVATAISTVSAAAPRTGKYIQNGRVVITKGGKTYTTTGALLK